MVGVHTQLGTRGTKIRALLDTGSPLTIFDCGVAHDLGVRIGRKGAEQAPFLLYGNRWDLQFEHVDLSLVDSQESWTARVGFVTSDALRMPFRGLLGSSGFFDRYVVTFAEYQHWVRVEHAADLPPV